MVDNLYKLIIVDDELFIRKGMESFHWRSLGFVPLGSASNGKNALELMDKEVADVVITDIKMPVMNGLELSRILQEKYPDCRIIILTGYEDFSYAKTAISVGAFEYILKPIDLNELNNVFLKLKEVLDDKKKESKLLLTYEKQLEETLPFAVENFFEGILHQKVIDLDEIEEEMEFLEISAKKTWYVSAVYQFNVTQNTVNSEHNSIEVNELSKKLEHYFEENNASSFFMNDTNAIIAVINFDTRDGSATPYETIEKLIVGSLEEVSSFLKNHPLWSSQVCVGDIFKNILSLSKSYTQCRLLQGKSFFAQGDKVFYFWKEKIDFVKTLKEYPYEIENKLINAILEGNKEKSNLCLNDFLEEFLKGEFQIEPEYIKSIVNQLLNILDRRFNKNGSSLGSVIGIEPPFAKLIERQKTFFDLRTCIEDVISKVTEYINNINDNNKTSSMVAVKNAIDYIKEHYYEKISLNQVAEHVYLNGSYLSVQFKKEIGKNFIEYLKEYRLEMAKVLLKRADLKIYTICEMVGYDKQQYFSDSFKAYTGMTPMEFRQKTNFN